MEFSFTETIFWVFIVIVLYTFVGYGILLCFFVKIKRLFRDPRKSDTQFLPGVTILIAAYNEQNHIREKIENTLSLNYPEQYRKIIIVTDGSTDDTVSIVREFPQVIHLHEGDRKGKIVAVSRAMSHVDTEITVFTDANTDLALDALWKLARHFDDKKTGAVAGEKRIKVKTTDVAAASGEGFYWKYESKLKAWDSELNTVVGAAGELFAIRTHLFEEIPGDTLIEDFYLTLKIAQRGFKVKYEPEAFALEEPSASTSEELKRKIRIAAGGLQSISRLLPLLNIFKYGMLSFQYISHRVLRWTLMPLALPLIFLLNVFLAYDIGGIYILILFGQLVFYVFSLIGLILEKQKLKFKLFFLPFYFCLMNYAVYVGFLRLITGKQTVIWERAERRMGQPLKN